MSLRYFFLELPSQVNIAPPTMARITIPIITFITVVLLAAADRAVTCGVDVFVGLPEIGVSGATLMEVDTSVGTVIGEPVGRMTPLRTSRVLPG